MTDSNSTQAIIPGMVSVIIPVKNIEKFIIAAINSVLQQSYQNLEVICVDDGCTDKTVELIEGLNDERIRVIPNQGQKPADARNTAFKIIRGEFVVYADGDDIVEPSRFEKQISFLNEHPEFGAVCGEFQMMTPEGDAVPSASQGFEACEVTNEIKNGTRSISLCSFLTRSKLVGQLTHRNWFKTSSDLDFQFRMAEIGRIWFVPGTTFYYRLHATSNTHSQANNIREFYEATARAFILQRKEKGTDDLAEGNPPPIPESDNVQHNSEIHLSNIFMGNAWRLRREGKYFKAIASGFKSLKRDPLNLGIIKSVILLMIKPKV